MSRPKDGCWDCDHAEWAHDKAGRRMSHCVGKCTVEEPVMPYCFTSHTWGRAMHRSHIHDRGGADCPTFKPREKK